MAEKEARVWEQLVSERQLTDAVVALARACGWLVHHDRPGLDRRGRWSTPLQGHPGFPDLVLVRPPRVVVAEVKREDGKLSDWQQEWLSALASCPGVETYCWRPSDWLAGEVQLLLSADPK